jgi:hypothetical protein
VFLLFNFLLANVEHFQIPIQLLSNFTSLPVSHKIFCIIITAPQKFKDNRPLTVLNVWARKCDNYRFITVIPNISNVETNKIYKTREIGSPLNLMQPRELVSENYHELTDKVFGAFKRIDHEFGNYDWYLKGSRVDKINV